jgi:NAD(P)-dependent dehydrogenase (short-subunit alcohol dehydrogenase family)
VKPGHFKERAVAVVAAADGLGPSVVEAFSAQGARVAVDADGPRFSHASLCAPFDIREPEAISDFFARCEKELGGLDVLVMSARPVATGAILERSPEEFRSVVESELIGPMACLREAGRRMAERGRGRIISFSSMSGKTGVHPGVGPFAAAKGGLIAFSRVLAAELAPRGVTVNVIATSLFETQAAALDEEHRKRVLAGIPVGRFGRSVEAAEAALFLASDDAGYITGETLNMSGGRFMD